MLQDQFGRTITYLRVSVTDRCNYRCTYCMPGHHFQLKPYAEILRYEEIEQIVKAAAELGISKVRLTGGEPLVKKRITTLVEKLAQINGLEEITMTTNGSLLTSAMAHDLKRAGLSRINISLDTLDSDRFTTLTRGGRIGDVLAGIEAARQAGLDPIKINMVVFPETGSGEIAGMRRFCEQGGLQLQTIKHFSLNDNKDPGGAVTADRPPKCSSCNRLRVTADGFIKPCLFSGNEIRIDLADIKQSLQEAVAAKPENGRTCLNRTMNQIGG